jgi:NHL repeat
MSTQALLAPCLNKASTLILTLMLALSLVLTACGGDSGYTAPAATTTPPIGTGTIPVGGTSTTPVTTTSTTGLPQTGITYPLTANFSVRLPIGAMLEASNGTVTTVNAAGPSLNVLAGTLITIPLTATGTTVLLVTAMSGLPDSLTTTLPTITALAGSPSAGGPPVDGTGNSARFWGGGHLAADPTGNVLVSDGGALRQVTPAGVVTTLAAGYLPYDWEGIAVDAAGAVYGSGTSYAPPPDRFGATIQRLSSNSSSTVLSNWTTSATVSALGYGGLAIDSSGSLYLTDALNHRILKFTAGVMSVFAGSGSAGSADGTGRAAGFNSPSDLAIDASGNLFVSDTRNSAVRKITPAGVVSTVTKQLSPGAITVDPTGLVYVIAGSPRTLFRISRDLTLSVSYPLAGISDPITGLAADRAGNVFAGTFGVGSQIFRISF